MVCLSKKRLGSTSSPWYVPRLVTHSSEAFTYLFVQNISTRLLSANKNTSADLLKLSVTGNSGLIWDPRTQTIHFSPKFVCRIWINRKFPITNFKRSAGKHLLAERRSGDISAKQVWKCFIWVTNLGTYYGEVLPNFFLLRQTIRVEEFVHTVKSFQTKEHKINQRHQKKLMQTSWFQANIAIYLWSSVTHRFYL